MRSNDLCGVTSLIRSRQTKSNIVLVVAVTLFALLATSAFAQFEKGSLGGTVTDSSGAVISGANVTITSIETGAARTATTDSNGSFTLTALSPGTYEIQVSQKGFATFKQKATISPGLHGVIDVAMSPQAQGETVEVTADIATQVDTQTSSINQVVGQTQIASLPTLTRDPYDFVQTLGNVNQDSAAGNGGQDMVPRGTGVAINGQRSSSVDALLDGGENVDLYTTKVGQSVPIEAVQEFSVTSNNFSAEYGRASGGVINVVTKSGTNDFHGSVFEFNRLSAYTSNDYDSNANGVPKAGYTRNQFGYSFGGPIVKNKLFFFSTTEWTRVRSAANILQSIVDPQLIAASADVTQGYFGQYSFRAGLTTPQVLSATDVGNDVPLPTQADQPTYYAYACQPGSNPCVSNGNPVIDIVNYQAPNDSGGGAPQNTFNMVHRVDYNLSNKTTIFGRYALLHQNLFDGFVNQSPWAGFDTGQTQRNQNALISVTHVWSPRVVTDSKVSFNRLTLQQPLNPSQPVQPTLYFNINFDETIQGTPTCLLGYSCLTPGNSIPFGGPQNVAQFAQAVGINTGKHDLRFGGQYVYTQDNRTFGAYQNAIQGLEPGGNGLITDGLENLMTGQAGWFQVVVDPQGKFPCFKDATGALIVTPECSIDLPTGQPSFSRSNRYNDFAFYGQDNWKVLPRLTLNLGLRWEYYGVQHNNKPQLDSNFFYGAGDSIFDKIANGRVNTVAATPNSPASPVGGLWEKRLRNFSPRVGFAWDVFGDGKTSLRGGYGIAYERNFGNITFNVIQNPPAQFNSTFQSPSQPFETTNLGPFAGTGTKALPNPSLRYVKQDLPTAYAESWNLSVQRELLRNSVVAIEYSGSHGVHLYSIENLNQQGFGVVYLGTDPVSENPRDRLNRQYGNMNTRGANGFSNYNAVNTRFTSSNLFNQGLNLNVNYTYSHTLDNLSSSFSETPQTENLGLLDPFQPALDYGNADFDARHRIAISAVWDLPYARNTHGLVRHIADGWEVAPIITAHTGNPFTVFDSAANLGDTVAARFFVPDGAQIPRSGNSDNAGALGPNTFTYLTVPASATYADPLVGSGELPTCDMVTNGDGHLVSTGQNCQWPGNMMSRNSFQAPGAYFVNLALGKSFRINERFNLKFRSEFYNLFNHSNYYVQSGGAADLGGAAGPIIGKRGVNPAGGVPNERRFIQFALKLQF